MIENNLIIEDLSSDYIKENIYEFQIDVFDGAIGKPSPMLEIHVFFDNDEFGDEIGLSLDWYKGYFSFEPNHTFIIQNGEKYESYNDKNEFLYNLVAAIKNWAASNNERFGGLYSSTNLFKEYGRKEIPPIYDYRKKYDLEYLYVVSVGINNSIDRTKLYKKQISFEELSRFLEMAFYGVDDYFDDGIFYKVFIENNIMNLKDYDDIFLKPVKKDLLKYESWNDEEIRSVYSSEGIGIRCPECAGFIKYSADKKRYKCVLCGKRFSKKYLSEKYNTNIFYEEFPRIFKGNRKAWQSGDSSVIVCCLWENPK